MKKFICFLIVATCVFTLPSYAAGPITVNDSLIWDAFFKLIPRKYSLDDLGKTFEPTIVPQQGYQGEFLTLLKKSSFILPIEDAISLTEQALPRFSHPDQSQYVGQTLVIHPLDSTHWPLWRFVKMHSPAMTAFDRAGLARIVLAGLLSGAEQLNSLGMVLGGVRKNEMYLVLDKNKVGKERGPLLKITSPTNLERSHKECPLVYVKQLTSFVAVTLWLLGELDNPHGFLPQESSENLKEEIATLISILDEKVAANEKNIHPYFISLMYDLLKRATKIIDTGRVEEKSYAQTLQRNPLFSEDLWSYYSTYMASGSVGLSPEQVIDGIVAKSKSYGKTPHKYVAELKLRSVNSSNAQHFYEEALLGVEASSGTLAEKQALMESIKLHFAFYVKAQTVAAWFNEAGPGAGEFHEKYLNNVRETGLSFLKNGDALARLVSGSDCVNSHGPRINIERMPIASDDRIRKFLQIAKNFLKISQEDLFTPEEFLSGDCDAFVLNTLVIAATRLFQLEVQARSSGKITAKVPRPGRFMYAFPGVSLLPSPSCQANTTVRFEDNRYRFFVTNDMKRYEDARYSFLSYEGKDATRAFDHPLRFTPLWVLENFHGLENLKTRGYAYVMDPFIGWIRLDHFKYARGVAAALPPQDVAASLIAATTHAYAPEASAPNPSLSIPARAEPSKNPAPMKEDSKNEDDLQFEEALEEVVILFAEGGYESSRCPHLMAALKECSGQHSALSALIPACTEGALEEFFKACGGLESQDTAIEKLTEKLRLICRPARATATAIKALDRLAEVIAHFFSSARSPDDLHSCLSRLSELATDSACEKLVPRIQHLLTDFNTYTTEQAPQFELLASKERAYELVVKIKIAAEDFEREFAPSKMSKSAAAAQFCWDLFDFVTFATELYTPESGESPRKALQAKISVFLPRFKMLITAPAFMESVERSGYQERRANYYTKIFMSKSLGGFFAELFKEADSPR